MTKFKCEKCGAERVVDSGIQALNVKYIRCKCGGVMEKDIDAEVEEIEVIEQELRGGSDG